MAVSDNLMNRAAGTLLAGLHELRILFQIIFSNIYVIITLKRRKCGPSIFAQLNLEQSDLKVHEALPQPYTEEKAAIVIFLGLPFLSA